MERERMSKKIIFLMAAAIVVSISQAHAQQAKVYRIGALFPGGPLSETIDGLRGGLGELGLEEGKKFTLAIVDTKGDAKAAEEAAKKFEREKFDLIYALTTPVVTPAKAATTNIPIVFCVGTDPVAMGLVDSFVKPGGRLTGVQYLVTDLTAKRLEILKEILPKLNRVITFYNPGDLIAPGAAKSAREEAGRLGLKFIERHVTSVEELRKVLQALKPGEADAYFYVPDSDGDWPGSTNHRHGKGEKVADDVAGAKSRSPRGRSPATGRTIYEIGRVSAKYVQRVLSGVQPRDLKVETVDDVELVINLQTAKALGLTIPPNVLVRARKVIK